ncbi:DSHCT domain-containing protein, partial [Hamiltosporidium tvaerminnensis]
LNNINSKQHPLNNSTIKQHPLNHTPYTYNPVTTTYINNTLTVLRDIIYNTSNTLYSCSSFKLSYNMILSLLINNINIMDFLKRTFMEDKVQREYKSDMCVIKKEEDSVKRVECSVCGVIGREEIWGIILRIMGDNIEGKLEDGLEGVNNSIDYYKGVNNSTNVYHTVNNSTHTYKGVNNSTSKQDPVNNSTHTYKGFNNLSNNYHPVNNSTHTYKGFNNSTDNYHPVNNLSNTYHPVNNTTSKQDPVNNVSNNYHPVNNRICKQDSVNSTNHNYIPVNNSIGKQDPVNNLSNTNNLTPPLLNYLYLLYEVCYCYNILITKEVLFIGMGVVIKNGNLYGIIKDIKGDNIVISNKDIYTDIGGVSYNEEGVSDSIDKQQGVNNKSSKEEGVSDSIDKQQGVNNKSSKEEGVNKTYKQQGVNNNSSKEEGVNKTYKQHPFNNSIDEQHPVNTNAYKQHPINNTKNITQHPLNNSTDNNTYSFTLPSYPHMYIFPVKEDLIITIKDIFYITNTCSNKDNNYGLSNCYIDFTINSIEGVIVKERLKKVLVRLTGVNNNSCSLKGCYDHIESNKEITGVNKYSCSLKGCYEQLDSNKEITGVNNISCSLKGCYEQLDSNKKITGVNNTPEYLKGCYNLLDHYKVLLQSFYSLKNIYFLFNKHSSKHLSLISEYYMRIRVLKYIKCINENNRVLLKGRVSIEIRSCYDLIGMCLIFNGVLSNISGEEIMSVISCIIEGVNNRIYEGSIMEGVINKDSGYKGVSNSTTRLEGVNISSNTYHPLSDSTDKQHPFNNNTNTYHPFTDSTDKQHPFNNSTNTYHPFTTSTPYITYLYPFPKEKQNIFINIYNIVNNTYNYITNIMKSFNLQPMYTPCYYYILPIYDWCIGKDLLYINNTYNIQEGDIIKVVLRLIEVCKELKGVSVLIGDMVLYNKIEEIEKCINRGVISIPSIEEIEKCINRGVISIPSIEEIEKCINRGVISIPSIEEIEKCINRGVISIPSVYHSE